MACPTSFKIDLTPMYSNRYWRVELVAWYIKRGEPGPDGDFDESSFADPDVVRAEFSLALTCPQFAAIRRDNNIAQTWERMVEIFEYCGNVVHAPLFRQVAHHYLDEKPETKESLRIFLSQIMVGEDPCPYIPSPLTVLRKLVTQPELFRLRRIVTAALNPLGVLDGVERLCGCNPYVPVEEIPENNISPLTCTYCHYRVPRLSAARETHAAALAALPIINPATTPENKRTGPYLKTKLVSLVKITSINRYIVFQRDEATIVSNRGEISFRAYREGPRFSRIEMDGVRTRPPGFATLAKWHRRLGHIELQDLVAGHRQFAYRGLKLLSPSGYESPYCKVCTTVKLPKLPLRPAQRPETRALEIIHADFCGPIPGRSKDTVLFFISFTDDATGWMTTYFVNSSTSILGFFRDYATRVERHFAQRIQCVQSNDALGEDFDDYLREQGIVRRNIPTDTYHIRALLETTRCLLMQAKLGDTLYSQALTTACYIRNRSSMARLDGLTPYQMWYGRAPSLRHMHEFGAKVICAARRARTAPLEEKEGRFLGLAKKKKAYRIWVPDYKKAVFSKEVDFCEDEDPQDENSSSGRRSSSRGTVERPSTSNTRAGGSTAGQARAVVPGRRRLHHRVSRQNSQRSNHGRTPQRNARDPNDNMGSGRHQVPNSTEDDSDSGEYDGATSHERNESETVERCRGDNGVGEPTATNEPAKDSQGESASAQSSVQSSAQEPVQPAAISPDESAELSAQTSAQPSALGDNDQAELSAQASAQPKAEGAGPGAIPRTKYHALNVEKTPHPSQSEE